MRILVSLFFMFFFLASAAMAGPFLVCDPYPPTEPQPTEFRISYPSAQGPLVIIISPAQTMQDGSKRLYWDLATLSPGTYNVSVVAARVDPTWGEEVSSPSPFTFTKPVPGTIGAPAGIKLQK